VAESKGMKPADLIHPLRIAVSGQPGGPSLFHMLEIIGRDRVLKNIQNAKVLCK
jgi:glutamyl-tRNA synthetase